MLLIVELWGQKTLNTFNLLYKKMPISKLCDGGARDSPKELGDSQKFSELKVGRNVYEFDDFQAGNNNSFAASRYLKQIPFPK